MATLPYTGFLAVLLVAAACLPSVGAAAAANPPPKRGIPSMIKASLSQAPVMALTYPIDTIKTRLQIPFGAPSAYQRSASAFKVRRINALQGPYWTGVVASCANQFPTFAIVYSTFEAARNTMEEAFPRQSKHVIDTLAMLIGSVAGSLWSTPCEVVKCTFQSGMYTRSLGGAVRAIYAETGAFGFYQGYTAQLMRDLPLYGVLLGSYETVRDSYINKFLSAKDKKGVTRATRDMTPQEDAALGFVAGAIAGGVTTPFDVVRTQATMRMWGGRPWWSASSSAAMMPRILAEQGVRGIFAGLPARSLYTGLGSAAFFFAYEKFLRLKAASNNK